MPDNFHYLSDKGEKCLETLKHELHEHPKTAIALAVGAVAAAVFFKDELAGLFPSSKQLLSDLKPLNAGTDFVDKSIPINSVDRAAVSNLLDRSEVATAVERGAGAEVSKVVSITSAKRAGTIRTFGEYAQSRDLPGLLSPASEKGHAFYERMGKPLTVAEIEAMSARTAVPVPAERPLFRVSEALTGDLRKPEPRLKLIKRDE
jgi:hypothetical protein